jgi:hypothetical protein
MTVNMMMGITKTHEELMKELLTEVQEQRRYVEELHQSFTRVTSLVETLLSQNTEPEDQQ